MALMLGLPNHGSYLGEDSWRRLVDLAVTAEEAGVDCVSVVDHVVMGENLHAYPYGHFPGGPEDPWLDPLTTLSAISGATSRLRLATGILIAPLRAPALLAKMAATLDVLSEGRLELGVGTGWQKEEYDALGLDYSRRHQLLDDLLAACTALWQGGPVDFSSQTLELERIYCSPRPVQPGGVPFWIGGALTRRNLHRIVTWGSGWMPAPGSTAEDVAAGVSTLRTSLREAGRDPGTLRVRVTALPVRDEAGRLDLDTSLASTRELLAAGGTDISALLQAWCPRPEDAQAFLGDFVPATREVGA